MAIQSSLKNPQDEPMPNLRCEEEIGLRPVGWLFDDGIELPCYPSVPVLHFYPTCPYWLSPGSSI